MHTVDQVESGKALLAHCLTNSEKDTYYKGMYCYHCYSICMVAPGNTSTEGSAQRLFPDQTVSCYDKWLIKVYTVSGIPFRSEGLWSIRLKGANEMNAESDRCTLIMSCKHMNYLILSCFVISSGLNGFKTLHWISALTPHEKIYWGNTLSPPYRLEKIRHLRSIAASLNKCEPENRKCKGCDFPTVSLVATALSTSRWRGCHTRNHLFLSVCEPEISLLVAARKAHILIYACNFERVWWPVWPRVRAKLTCPPWQKTVLNQVSCCRISEGQNTHIHNLRLGQMIITTAKQTVVVKMIWPKVIGEQFQDFLEKKGYITNKWYLISFPWDFWSTIFNSIITKQRGARAPEHSSGWCHFSYLSFTFLVLLLLYVCEGNILVRWSYYVLLLRLSRCWQWYSAL